MPFFDDFYADKLRGGLGRDDAEAVIDLRGKVRPDAEAHVIALLEGRGGRPVHSIAILIDPATATSGETLFQPVGRLLLDGKRRGVVERLLPLPARDGLGFFVVFPAKA
ncbi:MAG: hypothetical protein KF735_01585 [Chelatococcus sp.]|jgi:hypothetical protein|uniref:hypothetical protein n=1 Tax=unclassified Chelatococcus TaxID=2638111 RepID=UPI001BCC6111|nr:MULTISPECIES: hypothetical protein [unclassified Chelatococcus]CAH1663695.1 conserved hypothetical protein [Hyphomicrobiales bacterium]MBS7696070.1 hypothetical protein [Chelatococcus sp. YT9]MBS7741609.1 hypothetical protein [Chelatococcus sp. HY11]MBX3536302.1 hypothetical protein [Chelatococcus sp.]MBX3544372.1 hypothetical protein [Chelatococcus sp.]